MPDGATPADLASLRRTAVLAAAAEFDMLSGERRPVSARVSAKLLEAVAARTGLTSTTEILEYALAKVAIEDDYGSTLLALEGTIDPELDFEF